VIRALAPDARMVVGMSLGGLTNIALCTHAPELVRKAVLVDVTPGVDNEKGSAIGQFLAGPESFESFDEILSRTIEYNPTRTESSLRRGVLHNALRHPDGRWVWRHQQVRPPDLDQRRREIDFKDLWPDVSLIAVPVMLLRGMAQGSVIDDADEAEFLRRQPNGRVEHVEGAGHSLQGDQPVETARLLADFLDS
jgi:pimeloyl-ACP methyl ester carboxylesterase